LSCHKNKETTLKVTIDLEELTKKEADCSAEQQLIASDTQWHRTNPLNNAQRHSQYKPLIQSGGPTAAHESFQP